MAEAAMGVKLSYRIQEYEARSGISLRNALHKPGIPGEAVLATWDGEMITDDEIFRDGKFIKLFAVISGA
jgi:sulfur carrier protein ThiS